MNENEKLAVQATAYIRQLINAPAPQPLQGALAKLDGMEELYNEILTLRDILLHFSRGEISQTIAIRGFMAGALKSLQAHLRHLTWQVKQVEEGDFSQQVDFLGDFSLAFNNMVLRLDQTLTTLKQKEIELTNLAQTLQKEVNMRSAAVQALRQSEAEFKYLSEHDPLTGILNRRSFMSMTSDIIKESGKRRLPCCLAIMDVDHFKNFNDTYGHMAGDEALQQVVKLSNALLRRTDIMGRYGGEEFTFFFSRTDLEQGLKTAERIRKAIGNTPIITEGHHQATLTVSIGVVYVPPDIKEHRDYLLLQRYIQAADSALYQAKKNGRNQVTFAIDSCVPL